MFINKHKSVFLLLMTSVCVCVCVRAQVSELLRHQVESDRRDPGPVGSSTLSRREPEPPGRRSGGDGPSREHRFHGNRALTSPGQRQTCSKTRSIRKKQGDTPREESVRFLVQFAFLFVESVS